MIKICFVTTVSITIKSFLIDYARFLVQNYPFDVTFMCNPDPELEKMCTERIHFIPVSMKRGINLDGIRVINTMKKIFKQEQFDIIQYSTPNAAFYASIAAKKAKCGNRLYCQWGIRYMGFDGQMRFIFKIIEKMTCRNSTVIESESFSLQEFSIKEGLYEKEKCSVVWNGSACGVNTQKFDLSKRANWRKEIRENLNIGEDAFVFGYCGRITRDKGCNELFQAFREISSGNPNAYLLLVGQFDNEESIDKSLRDWVCSSPQVIIINWTSEIEKYYSAMDLFVSLSYREGFGLVIIEAAAMMLPAIVTDCPGQKDTIRDGEDGWLVPVKNVDQVISRMRYCMDNRERMRQCGMNAREHVEKNYEQQELFKRLAEHKIQLAGKNE